jgi:DNA polymerase-3 subunit gamma/tau
VSEAPSLYRRHRPRRFSEVVGQEHVVRTLRNAVEQGKVHHAYLFVGSRGTGKTSMAKILAACLNCERGGPTVEPCGVCASCVAIAAATSFDVIEMDAASNNSVDDIRDLRERVAFAPVSGRSKVYILDEAHMLSPQAWNAFLKTLEEPPPDTIFVLATTEAAKVLPTVVDRCHRFDFTRPTVEQIAGVLARVAGQESIEIGPDAVALVARHATGSFRDALGTLEQLLTYSGPRIATEDVLAVLGVADAALLVDALDAVGSRDARAALHAAARLVETGRDATQFAKDLEAHARDLMVVQALGEVPAELRLTPDRDARLAEQAQRVGRADVTRLLDLLAAALAATRNGADPRTQLELALVKAAAPDVDPSAQALMARIERLEAALAGATRSPAAAAPAAAAPPAVAPPAVAPPAVPPPAVAPPSIAPPVPVAPPVPGPDTPPVAAPVEAGAEPAREDRPAAVPTALASLELEAVRAAWPAVLDQVKRANALCAGLLEKTRPTEVADGAVTVAFPADAEFLRRKAEATAYRDCVGAALRAVTGHAPRLTYVLADEDGASEEPAVLTDDEVVARLVAEFDAEEIHPTPEEPA